MLAHKLASGNWKLFLESQLPFYFHLCVWEDEIAVWDGRPVDVSAGGSGQGLVSCWCSTESKEQDTSQRCGTLWQSCFLALELGSFARIWTARVNLWESGSTVSPQGGLFYFMVGFFFFLVTGLVTAWEEVGREARFCGEGARIFLFCCYSAFSILVWHTKICAKARISSGWGVLGWLLSFIFAKYSFWMFWGWLRAWCKAGEGLLPEPFSCHVHENVHQWTFLYSTFPSCLFLAD